MVQPRDRPFIRPAMERIKCIHFVGIGGVGMCGIAEVFLHLGHMISGSDINENSTIQRLRSLGMTIYIGHQANNVLNADLLVVSSAIDENNPEIQYARAHKIPTVQRAAMLAEIMRNQFGIAVAGTHGKTTTTSLMVDVFTEAKYDPTYIIGGRIVDQVANARVGEFGYLIAEADESDASFLHLQPMVTVITNIDIDHLTHYDNDPENMNAAFLSFIHNLPFYGTLVACLDDPGVMAMLDKVQRRILTYGIHSNCDFKATKISSHGHRSMFTVVRPENQPPLEITLNIPGEHNILNALAVIAVATDEGIDDVPIQTALLQFPGVTRRFETIRTWSMPAGDVTLVDDYGHHPKEIAATLAAARQVWPARRVVMVFQPHRYTRTRDLYEDFVSAFDSLDNLILLEVYPADEKPIVGADSKSLAGSIRRRGLIDPVYVGEIATLIDILQQTVLPGDLLLTQGAGNVSAIAKELAQKFTPNTTCKTSKT